MIFMIQMIQVMIPIDHNFQLKIDNFECKYILRASEFFEKKFILSTMQLSILKYL